jgi:hypothetical protein
MLKPIFLAALLAASPAWAINKCKGPDGKVTFQDAPCQGDGEEINVRPAGGAADASTTASADAQARLDKLKQDNRMAQAIREHEPLTGMDSSQLREAMGVPDKVNAGVYGGVQKDQLIYYRRDATWYVYTMNGVVESIQRSDPAPRLQAQDKCPIRYSALEIRNAEVSANSTTQSQERQTELLKQVQAMRECMR